MPKWDELSEAERNAAATMRLNGAEYAEVWQRYDVTNTESAGRKLRKRVAKLRTQQRETPKPVATLPRAADGEALAAAFIEWQRAVKAHMERNGAATQVDVRIDDDKPIGIALPADRHIGDIGTDLELQIEHAKALGATDGMYTFEGGDGVNNFINPKIVDNGKHDASPEIQYEIYAYILSLVKPVLVAHGNHDQWTNTIAGYDALAQLARRMQCVCTSAGAEIDVHVGSQRYVFYRSHKYRYNSSFNHTHAVKRMWEMGNVDFDVGIIDHNHVPAIEAFWKHRKLKIAIRAGTYKTNDEWARSQGFHGARIGVPILLLWPDEWRIEPWPNVEDVQGACDYLTYLRSSA